MSSEEPDLRRALEARSGRPSSEFRQRLASVFGAGRPTSVSAPAFALVAAVCLAIAVVGVLMLAGQGNRTTHGGPASQPRQTAPSPGMTTTRCPDCPIAMPTSAQLSAPSASVIWVLVQSEYLARSTDRGARWQQRPLPVWAGRTPSLEISFIDDHEGWLLALADQVGACASQTFALLHTSDAGATWTSLDPKGISDQLCKERISFADSKRGFISAWGENDRPVIYRTTDGGHTWTPSGPLSDAPGFTTTGNDVVLEPGYVGTFGSTLLVRVYAQGTSESHDYVYGSTDGGATWSYRATRDGVVDFVSATRWFQLGGVNEAYETTDSGQSWHPYASDYSQAAGVAPGVVFADQLVGYATVRGSIARTVDAGHHWVWITTPGT